MDLSGVAGVRLSVDALAFVVDEEGREESLES
jgi:hypothetical protein